MIVRVLLAALAAGLLAGIAMTPLQVSKIVPIILHAEEFEGGAHDHATAPGAADHMHENGSRHTADHQMAAEGEKPGAHVQEAEASENAPLFFGRFWNTVLANLATGAGFALLMAGVSMASGVNVTFATGLVWGAAGWMAVQFLPAIGLPPELPGFPYVDLAARQYWWAATVAMSIIGLALLFINKSTMGRAAGVALLVAPHLYGAPQPTNITSAVPAFLAGEFVVATLATTLFFWLTLGLAMGWFMDRAKLDDS
jgi:cobalt transporter subunit CbtA